MSHTCTPTWTGGPTVKVEDTTKVKNGRAEMLWDFQIQTNGSVWISRRRSNSTRGSTSRNKVSIAAEGSLVMICD